MDEGVPLLSYSKNDQSWGVTYSLHFVNPFDPNEPKNFSNKIKAGHARKRLARCFYEKLKKKDGEELMRRLDFIPWVLAGEDEDITHKEFIIGVISAVKKILSVHFDLDHDSFLSRDRDELFIRIYTKEPWLREFAEAKEYRLQFRKIISDNPKDFMKVPPYAKFQTEISGAVAHAVSYYKTYDINDNEDD